MNFSEWQQICDAAQLGVVEHFDRINSTDNHASWQLITTKGCYFTKTTLQRYAPMLLSEAKNLTAINNTHSLHSPQVVAQGQTKKTAWLVLQWITLKAQGSQQQLGRHLAALHQHSHSQFGWQETNFIDHSIQYNHWLDNWVAFYRAQRLMPQLRRAKENGLAQELVSNVEKIITCLDDFFVDHNPLPSLLHGNLSVNHIAFTQDNTPIVFNPASYYGDREMDIAMSELSKGFEPDFYTAYQGAYPLDKQYEQRKPIYQLYYLLNKFNLLGGDYAQQIRQLLNNL